MTSSLLLVMLCPVTLDKFFPSLPNVILIDKCQEALPTFCP